MNSKYVDKLKITKLERSKMRTLLFSLLSSLLLFLPLQAQPVQKAQDEWAKPIKKAHTFLDLLHQGKYDSVETFFDANVKGAMPAAKLKSIWESLESRMGKFQEQGAVHTEMVQKYHVVYVTCKFTHGMLDGKLMPAEQKKLQEIDSLMALTQDSKYLKKPGLQNSFFTLRPLIG